MPYAQVKGLDLYYEVHGTGNPLVLLPGGLLTIGLSFGAILPVLAETRQVIAVELQGHGHTADIDREPKSVLVQGSFFPPGERDGDQTGEALHDLRSRQSKDAYYEQELQKLRDEVKKLARKVRERDDHDGDEPDDGGGGATASA